MIGVWKLVLVLFIILLLFGAGRLPQVMHDIGKSIKNLKDGLKGEEKKNVPEIKENNKA